MSTTFCWLYTSVGVGGGWLAWKSKTSRSRAAANSRADHATFLHPANGTAVLETCSHGPPAPQPSARGGNTAGSTPW